MRRDTVYILVLAFVTVGIGTSCSKKSQKELPPLPPPPKATMEGASTNNGLSDRERIEETMGVGVSDEDRKAENVRAFHRLKSLGVNQARRVMGKHTVLSGADIYKKYSMKTGGMAPMAEAPFELLTSKEKASLAAVIKGCATKRTKVTITVNPKGKARLSGGQVLGTKLVECVAKKLAGIAFLEGKVRKGIVVIP